VFDQKQQNIFGR